MHWLTATIHDFGLGMGIDGLKMSDSGTLTLHIEGRGDLFLEENGDELLMYLARPRTELGLDALAGALELCAVQHGHPWPVHAALHGDQTLVFLIRIPESDCTLPALTSSLAHLARLQDEVPD